MRLRMTAEWPAHSVERRGPPRRRRRRGRRRSTEIRATLVTFRAATQRPSNLVTYPRVAFVLYAATAILILWLIHRFVRRLSLAAALVVFAIPLTITGYAL